MQLKPFTTHTAPASKVQLFPETTLSIAGIELGYITRNLMGYKNGKKPFVFHWKITVGEKVYGDTVEEVKEQAIETFRTFIQTILE